MTQACCEPVLQSTTGQWGMHLAQTSVALDLSWLTAHLYEEQFSIGAIAVAQACCAPVLQSTTEQWGCILTRPVLHCISVASLHTCMMSKSP